MTKEIAIVSGGLPHGPRTNEFFALGGSETAAVQVAKAMAARGHMVTLFCTLPPEGRPDFVQPGAVVDGVRWMPIEAAPQALASAPFDLLIASRQPAYLQVPHQAKKAVLWCHDLATTAHTPAIMGVAWNFDEIWAVSNFHADQIASVTGYPRSSIRTVRNGIIEFDGLKDEVAGYERDPRLLLYAARPERGLEFLVRPGGIMERLPEFKLVFSMYAMHMAPEHIRPYYQQLFAWAQRLPNVEFLGELSQRDLRALMAQAALYVYPSDFEETSCILGRECVSMGLPMIYCPVGALPETVGDCGVMTLRAPRDYDSVDEFCADFASYVRTFAPLDLKPGHVEIDRAAGIKDRIAKAMAARTDLDWQGAADEMLDIAFATASRARPVLARALALIENGDVIPARRLLVDNAGEAHPLEERLFNQIDALYPFLRGKGMNEAELAAHYEAHYQKPSMTVASFDGVPRFEFVAQQIAAGTKPGDRIVEIGCCEGDHLLSLARRFPDRAFYGVDHAPALVKACVEKAKAADITNVVFCTKAPDHGPVDAVVMAEVLEHVAAPWAMIAEAERMVGEGGLVITTTPTGPWEAQRIYKTKADHLRREHIWHIDGETLLEMIGDRPELAVARLFQGHETVTGIALGHCCASWRATPSNPVGKISVERKQCQPGFREVAGAAIICMNDEHDILRMLKSVDDAGIRVFSIALGPSTDRTRTMIEMFKDDRPWTLVHITNVPKLEAGTFGFDDARNASLEPLLDATDWALWIDSDEFVVGNPVRYLRRNAYDSYAVHQHHFTVEPRGSAPQVDRPARLIRTDRGMTFVGKIHEHAEKGGINGGPGFSMLLPDVDLGHTGYRNETTRRGRFGRNLPFLEWDRQVNPDRKLGKFLWLRDLIHQMRYAAAGGHREAALGFAREAVAFYDAYWQDMLHFGNGLTAALQYVSEARQLLGIGRPVGVQISLGDGRNMTLEGVIDDVEQINRLIAHALKPELELAASRYKA